MPNQRSGLFAREKQEWRQVYLNNLLRLFNNPDVLKQSLIMRGSIKKKEKNPTMSAAIRDAADVEHALEAIDKNDTSLYSIGDPARSIAALQEAGFTKMEIDLMSSSFQLMLDAAIFYAKDYNLLVDITGKANGPIEISYDLMENPDLGRKADKIDFTNIELTQLGTQLLKFQFANQFIHSRLKDIHSSTAEYKALHKLMIKLAELEKEFFSKSSISETDFQNFNKKYQYELFQADTLLKDNPDYAAIFTSIKPRSGLDLLSDTFNSNTANTKALGRTLLAIDKGTLTVNGQLPDKNYPIGEYLIHGGRVKFDVSKLSAQEQEDFFKFITADQAQKRTFGTHRSGKLDASGSPAETNTGIWGTIVDAFLAIIGKSKHYGINLAIGGNNIPSREGNPQCLGMLPEENGEWGHMYLHQDKNLVSIGIETAAPGKTNSRTGTTALSPFLAHKINSSDLRNEQTVAGKSPLGTSEENNWATVMITSEQLRAMQESAEDIETERRGYSQFVTKKPGNAVEPSNTRLVDMAIWAEATQKGNEVTLAQVVGAFLILAGIALMFAPIPGLAQLLGGILAKIGLGIAVGAIGAAFFAGGTHSAKELYNENAIVRAQAQASYHKDVNASPAQLVQGLDVKPQSTAPVASSDPAIRVQPGVNPQQKPVINTATPEEEHRTTLNPK